MLANVPLTALSEAALPPFQSKRQWSILSSVVCNIYIYAKYESIRFIRLLVVYIVYPSNMSVEYMQTYAVTMIGITSHLIIMPPIRGNAVTLNEFMPEPLLKILSYATTPSHLLGTPFPPPLLSPASLPFSSSPVPTFPTCLAGNHNLALPGLPSPNFPTFRIFISNTITRRKSLFSLGSRCFGNDSRGSPSTASIAFCCADVKMGGEEALSDEGWTLRS